MSQTNYSIDLNAAKGTKLFKKFLASKNKSVVSPPTIQNVNIQIQPHEQSYENLNNLQYNNRQPAVKTVVKQQQFPIRHLQIERKTERINNDRYHADRQEQVQMQKKYDTIRNMQSIQYNQHHSRNYQNQHKIIKSPPPKPISHYDIKHEEKEQIEDLPKKYQKLIRDYQELKAGLSNERKQHKIQLMKAREQIDMLNRKIYEVASREDDLIIENKRLQNKAQSENKSRIQIEQAHRQLGYQVQELKDMLDGNEQSIRKRDEEISHLRKINQEIKQANKYLAAENEKFRDIVSVYEREKGGGDRQKQSREMHLHQLRDTIDSLFNENNTLKDEIYHITAKLYQAQQENKSLKADLRRNGEQFPMEYLHERMQQSQHQARVQSVHVSHQNPHEQEPSSKSAKRGQFARERNQRRPRRQYAQEQQQLRFSEPAKQTNSESSNLQNKDTTNKIKRLQALNEEVQKLRDSKAMSGAMRRQKIMLERQILQIQQELKAQNQ